MTVRIFININNLLLPKEGQSFPIGILALHQGHEFRKTAFFNSEIIKVVGTEVLESDVNKNAFGFAVVDIEEFKNEPDKICELLQSQSYIRFRRLESFLQFLWFVKDNSVSVDIGYGYVPNVNNVVIMKSSISISTAMGTFVDTIFSLEEVEKAYKIMLKYTENIFSNVISIDDTPYINIDHDERHSKRISSNPEIKHYNEHNRISRAFTFLGNARNTAVIPHKISMYIPIYECLFSIENDEIKHKVAERTAHYIGRNREDKIATYELISKAYNIRSRFMHGSRIKQNGKEIGNDALTEICVKLDELTRKVLTNVVMEDSKIFITENDEEMRQYYTQLIFQ